jgi:hypothetical protein
MPMQHGHLTRGGSLSMFQKVKAGINRISHRWGEIDRSENEKNASELRRFYRTPGIFFHAENMTDSIEYVICEFNRDASKGK